MLWLSASFPLTHILYNCPNQKWLMFLFMTIVGKTIRTNQITLISIDDVPSCDGFGHVFVFIGFGGGRWGLLLSLMLVLVRCSPYDDQHNHYHYDVARDDGHGHYHGATCALCNKIHLEHVWNLLIMKSLEYEYNYIYLIRIIVINDLCYDKQLYIFFIQQSFYPGVLNHVQHSFSNIARMIPFKPLSLLPNIAGRT